MVTPGLKNKENQQVKKGEGIPYPTSKRLYTLKEVAIYLGRGLYGVREMVWRGELPVIQTGRKQFIDILDLEAYVTSNKKIFD
jgi:excisionase family DNA binding protein